MKRNYKTLLCAFLLSFGGMTTANADEVRYITSFDASAPVTDISTVQDGDYVVFYNNGRESWLTERDDYSLYLLNEQPPVANTLASAAYVFQVSVSDNGGTMSYAFMAPSGRSIPQITEKPVSTTDGTPGAFTISAGSEESLFLIQDSSNNLYFNGQASGDGAGSGAFVGWNASGGNSNYKIYKVETATGVSVQVTYNYYYQGSQKTSETINTIPGEPMPSPTSLPVYVETSDEDLNGTVPAEGGTFDIDCVLSEDFPFTVSESVDKATWYAFGLHTNPYYLHDTGDETSMVLGSDQLTVDASSTDAFDKSMWCFTGNPFDGFTIYNKAAGSSKILSSSTTIAAGTDGESTFPILTTTPVPEGNNTTWDITPSTAISGGFYIAQHGIATNRMNLRNGNLAYWTGGADAGSTFRVYDIQDFYEANLKAGVDNYVGSLKPEVASENEALINDLAVGNGTPEQYVALYVLMNNADNLIPLVSGQLYRIVSGYSQFETQQGVKKCVYNDGSDYLKWGTLDMADADNVFVIEAATAGNGYLLKNANKGLYMQGVKGMLGNKGTAETAQGGNGVFTLVPLTPGKFNLVFGNGTMHTEGHSSGAGVSGNLVSYGGGAESGSSWCIVPVTSFDVTIGNAGYATLNLPFAVELPAGVSAYQVDDEEADALVLSELSSQTIPANTPVLLGGVADTYTCTVPEDNSDAAIETGFTGTLVPTAVADGVNAYILAKHEGDETVKFYELAANEEGSTANRTIGANKAYYVSTGADAQAFAIKFGGQTTGIDSAVTTGETGENTETYYDLSGRRVLYPAKGIYVTGSGKKVLLK